MKTILALSMAVVGLTSITGCSSSEAPITSSAPAPEPQNSAPGDAKSKTRAKQEKEVGGRMLPKGK